MKRIRRCIALMGVACLLAFGSVGDSQVPDDIVGGWFLRDRVDVRVLHNILSQQPNWNRFPLRDLSFRPVLSTPQSRVFFGSVVVESTPVPTLSSSSGSGVVAAGSSRWREGRNSFGYVHIVGSGCAMPPDQLYLGRSSHPAKTMSSPRNRILSSDQFEFLLLVLEGLGGQGQVAPLLALGDWFEFQNSLPIKNFKITQVGSEIQLDFHFLETLLPGQPATMKSVQATILPSGGFDQVVVK